MIFIFKNSSLNFITKFGIIPFFNEHLLLKKIFDIWLWTIAFENC